jgi:CYTH domain-containing protein
MNPEWRNKTTYGLVLTEGPCGGKTTGQARLGTFFEGLGWKVYRVPETAAILLGGGVKLPDLTEEQAYRFQENLLKTMLQIEDTYHALASASSGNCLIIYDRGAMDAIAYMKPEHWERMKMENNWNEVELRDGRYHQVIHMISAAKGAEDFYHMDNRFSRHEGIELARQLDDLTSQAWVGHPYYDVVDNSTDFERKVVRMIYAVCSRLGIDTRDRLSPDSKKRKFLVARIPNDDELLNRKVVATNGMLDEAGIALANSYPQFQDFVVVHDYLVTPNQKMQARVRRRGQNGNWTYMHTIRRPEINAEAVELKQQISRREYDLLLAQKDKNHFSIHKKRRCFLWNSQYFQLDIYQEPCHPRCQGLMILETYTTLQGDDLKLPSFLEITREVTDDRHFSMHYLSAKDTQLEVNSTSNGDSHVTELQVKPVPGKMVNGVNPNDIDGLEYVE